MLLMYQHSLVLKCFKRSFMNTVKKKRRRRSSEMQKIVKRVTLTLKRRRKLMIIFKLNSELRSQDNQIIINLRKRAV